MSTELQIRMWLASEIGLDIHSLGERAVYHHLRNWLPVYNEDTLANFWGKIQNSTELKREICEAFTVPETWFWRNQSAFVHLRSICQKLPHRPLRILSLPCSTGEEPYSIAISLLEAGMAPDDFHIDAVDINRSSLAKAKTGIFNPSSFREKTSWLTNKFFSYENDGEKLRVRDSLTRSIHFKQGNILQPQSWHPTPPYHIVFCRNLLIYLDKPARIKARENLYSLMHPEALLFVGHAEVLPLWKDHFERHGPPAAFAYQRTSRNTQPQEKSTTTFHTSDTPALPQSIRIGLPTPQPSPSLAPALLSLENIEALANSGNYATAKKALLQRIGINATEAAAHCLLGIVEQASGNADAALSSFRKALYLNPAEMRARVSLALLMRRLGAHAEADQLLAGTQPQPGQTI